MKRRTDIDPYNQGIPKSKPFTEEDSHWTNEYNADITYVTREEFEEMQATLEKKIAEQNTLLEQLLIELRQAKLHLAAMSGEDITDNDVEE